MEGEARFDRYADVDDEDAADVIANNSTDSLESRRRRERRLGGKKWRKPVTFYAMGDAPYSGFERDIFPRQISGIPDDGDFVVHLGDMKGVDECSSEAPYSLVADALKVSRNPVFVTPGE